MFNIVNVVSIIIDKIATSKTGPLVRQTVDRRWRGNDFSADFSIVLKGLHLRTDLPRFATVAIFQPMITI